MYKIGDKVIYGAHGACVVADQENRIVDKKQITYLLLDPVGQEGTHYLVPTHSEVAMAKVKRLLSEEELTGLYDSKEVHTSNWIDEDSQRRLFYREIQNGADRVNLMKMLYALYRRRAALARSGRKLHFYDESFLCDAEKLLASEVSVVLNISQEQAKGYIRKKLGVKTT